MQRRAPNHISSSRQRSRRACRQGWWPAVRGRVQLAAAPSAMRSRASPWPDDRVWCEAATAPGWPLQAWSSSLGGWIEPGWRCCCGTNPVVSRRPDGHLVRRPQPFRSNRPVRDATASASLKGGC